MRYRSFLRSDSAGFRRFWMMTAICTGAFLSHFTAGVVHVSLPYLAEVFHTNLDTAQWITTGYLLVIALLLPIMGKLGDRYGHRRIHNFGFGLFSVASVLIAASPHLVALLGFRMLQAGGAAMFQATNIALITVHVPPERRGRALGTVSTAVALGAMFGPIAGGAIAEWLSWQWLFMLHVPVALIATWLAFRYIPVRERERTPAPPDPVGAFLFIVSVGSGVIGLTHAQTQGWFAPGTIVILSAVLPLLLLLLLWELRRPSPFLPVRALGIPAVGSGLILSCASFAMANIVLVTLPFYLSGEFGLSPSLVGGIMTAYPLLLAAAGPVAGHGSDVYGSRRFMLLGLCTMGGGLALFALYLNRLPLIGVTAVLALIGLGMGLIASPNNSYIMRHAPQTQVGAIGGMVALTRNLGMTFGAALGLGAMANPGQNPRTGEIPAAFGNGFWIAAAALLIFGAGAYWEARRNNNKAADIHQNRRTRKEKSK